MRIVKFKKKQTDARVKAARDLAMDSEHLWTPVACFNERHGIRDCATSSHRDKHMHVLTTLLPWQKQNIQKKFLTV